MKQPDTKNVLASLQDILNELFGIQLDAASPDVRLSDLGIDSMMVLDDVMETEDRLGIKLNDMTMPRDATLGDVVELVQRNIGASLSP
jgi:acyl carrier protein